MFVTSGVLYEKDETLKYNMIYLDELKKHKDHKSLVKISNLKREANNMTLEEMQMCGHKNLKEFIKLNVVALNALKSVLLKKTVPVEYAIEVISKMELGVNNSQFQTILMETMEEDIQTETGEEIIVEVIEKFKRILDSY